MKKLLLFISIALVSIANVNAQCIPDPVFTEPGIYPDSATGFAQACVGVLYEETVTNIVPVDTTVEIIPGFPVTLNFDSIVITSFTGLPPSMTYSCSTTLGGCSFAGGEAGCVLISGTPTVAEIGVYNPVITVDVYLAGGATPQATQEIDWYVINVADCSTNSVNENTLSSINVFPNPANDILSINGLEGNTESIQISDASGKMMISHSNINTASFDVNVENLESGIYFARINQNNNTRVIRFVKQ